jgi:hypothetical protein
MFLLACLFPWVSFGTNSMDTQPWPLVASIIYLLYVLIHYQISLAIFLTIPVAIVVIFSSIFVSMFYYGTFAMDFSFLRGGASYLTFIFVFVVYYFVYKRYGFQKNLFYGANIVWLIVGLLQISIGPYIFDSIVTVRTSDTRGVTGLSPEPTFYGFFLFFLNFIYLIQFNYKLEGLVKKLFVINLLFIFLVAQSSSVILALFVGILFVLIYRSNLLVLLWMFFSMFLLVFALNYFFPNSRLMSILSLLSEGGPLYLLSIDESVFARIMSIVYPYYWGIQSYLIPGGFHSIGTLPPVELVIDDYYFSYDVQGKVMSYFGSIFYELGFFSILVFLLFLKSVYDRSFRSILEFVFLFFCLQFALTIAFTLIPILLVTFYFRKRFNLINGAELYVQG